MAKSVLGFDIGGTKISAVVWDGKKIVSEMKLLTPKALAEFKGELKEMALYLSEKYGSLPVGVAVAGVVDRKKCRVIYSPNLKVINGFDFQKFFKGIGFGRVRIENDANCFALAESRLGQAKGYKNFVGLTLGTGLGSGIVVGGTLYLGAHGSGGEPGHMMADERYTYEKRFQLLSKKSDWRKAGRLMGRLSADILNLLDLEAVAFGGSVGRKFGNRILPFAAAETRKLLLNKKLKPKFYISKIKHAGAVGAALLWENK